MDIMCCGKPSSTASMQAKVQEKSETFKVHLKEKSSQKSAEILSVQYGVNVFLVGLLLMLAVTLHKAGITEEHLLSYLITLMLVQLLWMLWQALRKYKHKDFIKEKDCHAGARWLRGGLTLFAFITLILDSFKLGYFIGYSGCLSAAKGIYSIVHAVFTVSQVYFLWFSAKDVIQSFQTIERFGVIHSVFTNLLLWAFGILSESKHQLNDHKKRLAALGNLTLDYHEPQCNCTTNACTVFASGFYYLYPFYVEYHIFASAMLFVLWKNIGRSLEHHRYRKIKFRSHGAMVGTIAGLIALAITIGVLVYITQVAHSKHKKDSAIILFYSYGVTILTLMSAAGIIGLLIYRVDERPIDNSKNPSRKLDSDLLLASASGSWLIAWGSFLAIICTDKYPPHAWINLPYSLLVILETYAQNLFIIESIHRKHRKTEDEYEVIQRVFSVTNSSSNLLATLHHKSLDEVIKNEKKELPYMTHECIPHVDDHEDNEVHNSTISLSSRRIKLSRKRRILKNIAVFLFLCNISLWILPAFGFHPQYDSGLEERVFDFETWIAVVNLAMPFAIFYRTHSAASLFEVYCII
ncbi:proton channel OTOP1 [Latimeria chalumnae]|nr:PREDICTED: otopetrin-1 isoform X1 [Latimeria chalumnae]|eukprot:XP_006008981.1 PREDICTED: otopetrin-1 isoform X1 [Latimeria chalumnae]